MAADISQLQTQTLNQIVQLQGWPTKAQVTEEGVRAAFSLASHSNNLSFQQSILPFIIQSYMDKQVMSVEAVAILTDKVSMLKAKVRYLVHKQILIGGKLVFFKIENEDSVDQLIAQMGMTTLKIYKKTLEVFYGLQ
jgi:hypothetical protein